MANLTLAGTVLGLQKKPYDFTDRENGERRQGVTNKLWLWDDRALEPIEVRVPDGQLIAAEGLGAGEVVTLSVEVRTQGNRPQFRLSGLLASA